MEEIKLSETSEELLLLSLITRNKIQAAPSKTEYLTPHKTITIGIGNDHIATITIDEEALKVLLDKINIEEIEE